MHAAIQADRLAIVTGGADGIGLAVAASLLSKGMRLALLDADVERLEIARASLGAEQGRLTTHLLDVADRVQFDAVASRLISDYGAPAVLMNNAAVAAGGDLLADPENWARLIGVNLMGVFHGVSAFLPAMIGSGTPGVIVNTGSKQGITQPPGNTAYNVSKSAVKSLTEGLAHTLREKTGERVTAHLLVPGFTYTGMMRTYFPDKPAGAWLPQQVADYLMDGLERDDFYIICPDNETTSAMDAKRIAWSMGDMIENRPALSRWHPDFKERFEAFMRE